jgi:hypothetical protein
LSQEIIVESFERSFEVRSSFFGGVKRPHRRTLRLVHLAHHVRLQ